MGALFLDTDAAVTRNRAPEGHAAAYFLEQNVMQTVEVAPAQNFVAVCGGSRPCVLVIVFVIDPSKMSSRLLEARTPKVDRESSDEGSLCQPRVLTVPPHAKVERGSSDEGSLRPLRVLPVPCMRRSNVDLHA